MSIISPNKGPRPLPGPSWRVSRDPSGSDLKRGSSYSFLCGELGEEGLEELRKWKFLKKKPEEEPKRTTTGELDRAALNKNVQIPGEKNQKSSTTSARMATRMRMINKYPSEAGPERKTKFKNLKPRSKRCSRRTLRTIDDEKVKLFEIAAKSVSMWPGKITKVTKSDTVPQKSKMSKLTSCQLRCNISG